MEYRMAKESDIEGVLALHKKYHVDTVSEEDRADGFVTTQFDGELLRELIHREKGLFVAEEGDRIAAYVMAASWGYCSRWPLFQHMIERLGEVTFLGQTLTCDNSYQYGPVCIDGEYRGTGVLERIFDLARKEMGRRYPILVTFVNKKNPRSARAHSRMGLTVALEFEYRGNAYYEYVYDTSRPVEIPPPTPYN